jgi:hypothetical protein
MVHRYVRNRLCAIPPGIAVLLNLKLARRVPNPTAGDLLATAPVVPVELFRRACGRACAVVASA